MDAKSYNWTAFVRISNEKLNQHIHKLIDKVEFGLNTDFRTLIQQVTITSGMKKPFEYSTIGWIDFVMPITIFWSESTGKQPEYMKIDHQLVFEPEDSGSP